MSKLWLVIENFIQALKYLPILNISDVTVKGVRNHVTNELFLPAIQFQIIFIYVRITLPT